MKILIFIIFCALFVLHQDFWNWDSASLVFGFLPIGLAYHAGYSLVAACFWGFVIHFAWPSDLEAWANEIPDGAVSHSADDSQGEDA